MNGASFYHGLVTASRVREIDEQIKAERIHPKRRAKIVKATAIKEGQATKRRLLPGPADVRKHKVKIEVGFYKGQEVYETLEVSLNELKEGFRRTLSGDGSYPDAIKRVAQFKAERQ